MGGSKERDVPENKVPLCRECHDLKTVGRIETWVNVGDLGDGVRRFYEWRRAGSDVVITIPVEVSKRYKCLVLSDGDEAAFPATGAPTSVSPPSPSAGEKEESDGTESGDTGGGADDGGTRMESSHEDPSLGELPALDGGSPGVQRGGPHLALTHKEEGDGEPDGETAEVPTVQDAPEDNDVLGGHGDRDLPPVREGARGSVRPERSEGINEPVRSALTHEQRVAIAQDIKDAQQRRQFLAGDTANQWEDELGEDFWNLYANEFGYTYPSLRNVMRVCKKIPQGQRHDEMSFAHHEALQSQDIETREAWLERAFEEEWPVKRLREELVAEGLLTAKPKAARWTAEDLLEEVERWPAPRERLRPRGAVKAFIQHLEEQA